MTIDKKLLGRYGEKIAADFLIKKGYTILASGYRGRFGEIDLIARQGELVCFVEVKTRQDNTYLAASAAVDSEKRRRIIATANQWLGENEGDWQIRYDIVEVYVALKKIKHIKDAF